MRHLTDLLSIALVVLLTLGAIFITVPDPSAAKRALEEAGFQRVNIYAVTMPCRADGKLHLYGVFFGSWIPPAPHTNHACFTMSDGSWTAEKKPGGI